MKKRILSMLLLVAMIITAVPVMSTAAGASSSTIEYADFADLYVQDNLQQLYMAFVGDTSSLNVFGAGTANNNSTWTSKVGDNVKAWLKADGVDKGAHWYIGKHGGVGFDYKNGYLDATGTFVKKNFGGNGIGGSVLIFGPVSDQSGINSLPTEDVTVEYVAEYKPVYVAADETGLTFALDADGNRLETYTYQGSGYDGGYASWPIDSIGWFQGYTNALDGATWGGGRGVIHFVMDSRYWTSGGNGRWVGGGAWSGSGGLNVSGDPFHKLGGIYSYAYVLDETVTTTDNGDGTSTTVTTALFELYRNGALYNSNASNLNSSANGAAGNGYYNLEENGNGNTFYLSAGCPTDFYAVRVYADVLTAAEKAQNHMVDVLAYYDVKVPNDRKIIDALNAKADAFAAFAFEKDDAAYAATKLAVEAAVEEDLTAADAAHQLYVKDGLVSLYTAFVGDMADANTAYTTTGTWANRIAGGDAAAFRSHAYNRPASYRWTLGANGGVGFELRYGLYAQNAETGEWEYTAQAATKNGVNPQNRLAFPAASFPQDDFTVEYLAQYHPVYVEGADGNLIYDENGKALELYDLTGNNTVNPGTWTVDLLGWFGSYTTRIDGYEPSWSTNAGARACVNWYYTGKSIYWSSIAAYPLVSGAYSPNGSLSKLGDPWQQNNVINVYTISVDETIVKTDAVVDESGAVTTPATENTTALFSLYRNGKLFNSNQSKLQSTADGTYSTGVGTSSDGFYHLSSGRPTTFWAVRIYNRTLNAFEMMQNRFADAVLYYNVAVDLDFVKDAGKVELLKKAMDGITFLTDSTEIAAKTLELNELVKEIDSVELGGYADMYVTDGLTALYTAFAGDNYIDLDAGTWTDRVAGAKATLGNKQYWTTYANGGVGVTQLWGSYIDGVFTETVDTNTFNVVGTRLEFGIEQLPYEDYTVEYVAQYNSVMAVGADGKPVQALNTIDGATWPNNAALSNTTYEYVPIDTLGNLQSFSNSGRDKAFAVGAESYYGGAGSLAWKHNSNRPHNGWNSGSGAAGLFKGGADIWQTRGSVNTFEISRDTTSVTNNLITLTRNGVTYSSGTFKEDISVERDDTPWDFFYLGERLSVDYYAVRVYARTLTAAERAQNRFVDILLFYGLEIPEEKLADAEAMQKIKDGLASATFDADASMYSAKKAALQEVITPTLHLDGMADLYVKDGLTALYTAFVGDNYIDLDAGTWTDRVAGATATLGNKQYWTTYANGGVGVTQLWGTYVDGVFTKDADTNTYHVPGTRLEFGISQLPVANYTVEYVIDYNYIMAADANGNAVDSHINIAAAGVTVERPASNMLSMSDLTNANTAVDQFGNLMSFYGSSGHDYAFAVGSESYWGSAGSYAFRYNSNRPQNGHNSGNGTYVFRLGGQTFYQRDNGIITYEIGRTLATAADAETGELIETATLTAYRNMAKYSSGTSTMSRSGEHTGNDDWFYLGERASVDYYAVRIYNRELSAAERLQNHFVDVVLYYGLTVPADTIEDIDALVQLHKDFASVTLAKDASEYEVVKTKMQNKLDGIIDLGGKANLYVTKGLVALFTAFAGDGAYVNTTKGTWTDRVNGATATLKTADRWYYNATGGVGYTTLYGMVDANGTFTTDSAYNQNKATAVYLGFEDALYPQVDATVEYLAKYLPVYVADEDGNIATDASGTPLELYNYAKEGISGFAAYPIDKIGWFNSFTNNLDGQGTWGGFYRGTVAWLFNCHHWTSGGNGNWLEGTAWSGVNTALSNNEDPWETVSQVRTYEFSVDETVTAAGDTEAYVALYRDGAFYRATTNSTANGAGRGYTADDATGFWLSRVRPTEFYSVRIYNRVLSNADRQQNHLADVIMYYGADVPENMLPGGEKYEQLASALGGIGFVTDAVERAATSLQIKATIRDLEKNSDLLSLYVQDNLVALFTALNALDGSANANGTWANRVYGGASAQFVGGRWTKNINGSVGTTQVYGSYINEEWNANSEYNTLTFNEAGAPNGIATQLKFDSVLLDSMNDDYTLEFVAQYRPTMAVDANGNPVAETFKVGKLPSSGAASAAGIYGVGAPVDQVGFLRGFTTSRDGDNQGYGRGVISFAIASSYWSGYQGWQTDTKSLVLWQYASVKPVFYTNNEVINYAIIKDENDAHTAATYSMMKNGALWMDHAFEEGQYDFSVAEKSVTANFYLADNRSVDFFAVRIYSDVLTAYEMAQNKAVDIAYYYGLELPAEVYTNTDMLGAFISALSDASIVIDTAERAAKKAEYQARLDNLEVNEKVDTVVDYNSLYVQNGLVGLYTAFAGDDAVNVMTGTWANAIDNEYGAATLRGTSFWKRGTVGVGYTIDSLDSYKANAYKVGIELPEAFENLDTFTVEAFATAKGITNADGSRYSQSDAVYIAGAVNVASFRFGMLNALFFAAMNPGNADATRFAARWFVSNITYPGYTYNDPATPGGNADLGYKLVTEYTNSAGKLAYDDSDQGWRNMGPMYNPTAGVMQVSKVTDAIGDVTYAIKYNGSETAEKEATIKAEKYALYAGQKANAHEEGRFSLFSALPADVYAIRVYNRELTAAEKLQNSFVDKAGFYQIDLSKFNEVDDKVAVYEYFATIGTDLTKEAAQALYDMKVSGGTNVVGNSVLKFQKYLPVLNGAYGYRVLFTVSETSVDMIEDAFAGYKVSYGAIVAPASSNTVDKLVINSVSDTAITTSATNGQVVIVGGELGSNIFYNYTDIGMGEVAFSVAVTANDAALFDADMIVRAFVTITDADGKIVGSYYDEAVENDILDGTVSITTAADYFVNEFEGDVATEYKYMNAATLRYVLQQSGRDVTREIADDLVLYVDPVNGSDDNNGESMANALATLDKAYVETKAHLAQTGLKNVTIYLAAGEHYIANTFKLSADEINADEHSVKIVGLDGATVSSAQLIDKDAVKTVDGLYYVQLPKVNGEYPVIRDLMGYDTDYNEIYNFTMSSKGSEEVNYKVLDLQFTDGTNVYDGADKPDWQLEEDVAAKTTYAIITLESGATAGVSAGAELHFTTQWCYNFMHVAKVEGNKIYVDYNEFKNIAANAGHNLAGDVVWFENSKSFLAGTDREFAYDQATGTLFFTEGYFDYVGWLRTSTLENLFALEGVNNFSIENVTLTGYADHAFAAGVGMGFGQSGKAPSGFRMASAIYAKNIDGLTVKNVTFANADAAGIAIDASAKNIIIDSNRFENLGNSAIIIAGGNMSMSTFIKNVTITNNFINEIGNTVNNASGIVVQTAANMLIAHNTITNVPYTGISLGWNWDPHGLSEDQVRTGIYRLYNVEVAYNYVADYMLAQHDGGAIYTLGGALSIKEAKQVNYVHHNYVNITAATGEHKGSRFFAAYYHDGGSSNWHNYSNVLMNSKNSDGVIDGLFGGYFVQYNKGNDGYNNLFEGNYAIGFKNNVSIYNDVNSEVRFSAERGNYAEAYAYLNVGMLNINSAIVEAGEGDRNCHLIANPNAQAAEYVYSVYAAAGSSLDASTKTSGGLTKTAAAIADDYRLTEELTFVPAGSNNAFLVTFNLNGKTFTVPYANGDTMRVPAEFDKAGFSYAFKIDGETVDLTKLTVSGNVTVDVEEYASIQDVIVTDGATSKHYQITAGQKLDAEMLAGFAKEGFSTIYTIDGEVVDLDKFTVGAEPVEIWAQYVKNSYKVTFTDGETVLEKNVLFGDKVLVPASYELFGHATKAALGEVDVTNGYNMPAENITINITYVAKDYKVTFVDEDGKTVLNTITVTFGQAINAPEAPANKVLANGYIFGFDGWKDFEDGQLLETEGLTVVANTFKAVGMAAKFLNDDGSVFAIVELPLDGGVVTAPAGTPTKAETDEFAYTFAGWEGFTDGMTVTEPTSFQATFAATAKYTITFKNEDGSVINSYVALEGDTIVLPEDPTKAEDDNNTYTFAGWNGYTEGMTVSGNHEFTAEFDAVAKKVTITFTVDGVVYHSYEIEKGALITLPEAPAKAEDENYTYTFAGWDGYTEGMTATADVTFEATFDATEKPAGVAGDIDGSGRFDPADIAALIIMYNDASKRPADESVLDLDGSGRFEPADIAFLINMYNNLGA